MGDRFYAMAQAFGRFVKRQCIREFVLHAHRADRAGGFILAPTHVSHVEPMLLMAIVDRPIAWMARIEFFRFPPLGALLRQAHAFAVNRTGVPVAAIRRAIRLAQDGDVVGIFPEGGCRKGKQLAIRGGRIKQGLCTVSIRAQVPIVPVVVLGTHGLNDIDAWIPGQQGQTWVAFGEAIDPPPPAPRGERRRVRRAFARQVEHAYVELYHELLHAARLSDSMTP